MPYAIMRWAKVTSQTQADKATGHNYRTDRVANADKEPPHPNVEFINTAGRGYWELATERIEEVVTRKVRDDQVRCMEVILTASPEHFERDQNGRAVNMADSQWAKDQVDFLKKTFGEKNVLSCTLHQDEKSPHFHAVIVPITEDGRLSAKDLFNPKTLTGYQNEYAEAMKAHGLSRGVEHSQAKHQDMKRMYAQQAESSAAVGAQLGPASSYQAVQVKRPGAGDMLNLSAWEAKTTVQVNEQARAQVEAANQRAEKATNLAQENAAASERVRVLQKQLETVEGLKRADYKALEEQLQVAEQGRQTNLEGMTQAQEQAKRVREEMNTVAMRLAGGEKMPASLIKEGNRLLDELSNQLKTGREKVVDFTEQAAQAEREGDYGRVAELRYGKLQDQEKENKPLEDRLGSFAGGQVRLSALAEEEAIREDERARLAAERAYQAEQVRLAGENARAEEARLAREAAQQARDEAARLVQEQAAEKIRQQALDRENALKIREQERVQIERVTNAILTKNEHVYGVPNLINSAAREGIEVQHPERGRLLFRLAGSVNEFTDKDLKPGGREFKAYFTTQTTLNNKRWDQERSNDNQIER